MSRTSKEHIFVHDLWDLIEQPITSEKLTEMLCIILNPLITLEDQTKLLEMKKTFPN